MPSISDTEKPPSSTAARRSAAASFWGPSSRGATKSGSGKATTGGGAMNTVSKTPCCVSPSITLDEVPAACASPERVQETPSLAVAITRSRAAVMRSGRMSVRRSASTIGSGSKAAGARSAMRATSPGGVTV
ncbi:hypothetical protein D9M70_453970 [compost metagenome]